jgi:hypothetical protein
MGKPGLIVGVLAPFASSSKCGYHLIIRSFPGMGLKGFMEVCMGQTGLIVGVFAPCASSPRWPVEFGIGILI